MLDHYVTLEIAPNSSPEEVKSAYRRLAREAHPDIRGSAEAFYKIKRAFDVLGCAESRAQYDSERRSWMKSIGAVLCAGCGHANRLTHRPAAGFVARCWHCKTHLELTCSEVLLAQRQSLMHETTRVVEEIGVGLADLAADAVRSGIGRLRQRLGLGLSKKIKQ